VVAAIKENFFQAEIADAAFRYQQEVESEERVIVGVNRYQTEGQPEVEIHRVDPVLETEQIARVRDLRGRRDAPADEAALTRLKEDAAHDNRNLMGPIMDAARVYVTMGEMCDALREVWGTWRETPVF
jgi:methylmalonyl-CoA mutase N-terminal domain/subunit